MQITVQELAALVGGQFASGADPAVLINGVAAIAEAQDGDVTFFGNARYLPALKICRASAVLVPLDFGEAVPPIAIRVENPSLAFSTLVSRFAPEPIRSTPGVHPSAVVAPNVRLSSGVCIQAGVVIEEGACVGAGTVVGANSYIGHHAQIGANCQIAPRVTIGARCILAERVFVSSGVVIGSDGFGFEFSGGRHVKIPQLGIVQIDSDVEIGANTTIDRARFGRTWIGEGTKIDNLVQIAHNVVIGKHCIIVAQVAIAGSTKLGNYVTIAGQVGIAGHVEIGDQVTVGGGAGVTKNLSPGEVVWGTPAQPMTEVKRQLALIRRLPKLVERVSELERAVQSSPVSSAGGS